MAASRAGTPPPPKPRVIVYIDGFNLYYGVVKSTPALKRLDLERYCRLLRPHDDIQAIRYFTALVNGPTKPNQEAYLRALATTPVVTVILGKFKDKTIRCGVAGCAHLGAKRFKVPEEKRTDVNIAISMLDDAYQDRCDHLILFSGDSDLVPGLSMVRARFPTKTVTVYVPFRDPVRGAAVELRLAASKHRDLPLSIFPKAQFPDTIPDGAGGTINRPAAWR
jgi:6-hydroxy-3-succinoylpyridine 3-monooxygenase